MNRTSLSVATTSPGELSDAHDRVANDLAAAATWLDRIELVSRSLPRLPGLAATLHWLGLQLAVPLAASRFQVWQIHDWRDGAGLVQPWLESDDQAGVQRIDLAQLDLLREGEGALGLALSSGRAAVAPVRVPANGRSGDPVARHPAPAVTNTSVPHPGAASASARLCLAVGLNDAAGEPFAALEWWLDEAPVADALPALTLLARLVAARAPAWASAATAATASTTAVSEADGAAPQITSDVTSPATSVHSDAAARTAPSVGPLGPVHELAMAMASALPTSLVLLDTELNVLLVNSPARREFGLLPEQASGQGLAQLFGAAAGQDLAAGAAQSSTRGRVVEQQLVVTTSQGPRRVLARSSALRDATGQVTLLMCQLETSARDQPRLAGMSELAGSVTAGQFVATRAELERHSATSTPELASSAAAQMPAVARPISVLPGLSSARAASVVLAPRTLPAQARFTPDAPPDVLVIDDHAVNQELMVQMLLHLGCRARCAGSGEQGLAELCARPADLVLMDIRMPGMDGLQALTWIRQGPSQRFALRTLASLPVVAVTAHAVAGDADRCIEHGFDAYLAKPCRLEDLHFVLEGLLAWRPAQLPADAGDTQPDLVASGHATRDTPQPLPHQPAASGGGATVPVEPAGGGEVPGRREPGSTSRMGEGIPVFDHQALLRLRALDPSGQNQLLVRVMKAFDLSLQRLSTQLRSARQQQDVSAVRHAAHTLKSSSASVGAMRLSGLCLDVETALRRAGASFDVTPANAAEVLAVPVAQLLAEIDRVQAALPEWLASDGSALPVPLSVDLIAGPGAAARGANT